MKMNVVYLFFISNVINAATVLVSPEMLLNKYNLHIMAPYIYAQLLHKSIDISWGKELYAETIKALSKYNKQEISPAAIIDKEHDFKQIFHLMSESCQQRDIIKINKDNAIIEGVEQAAINLLFNQEIECEVIDKEYYSERMDHCLKNGGLSEAHLDALAFEFCKCNPQCHISVIWPRGIPYAEVIKVMLEARGCSIIYEKNFFLKNNGPTIFFKHVPDKAVNGGNINDYFTIQKNGLWQLSALLLQTSKDVLELANCKKSIRDTINKGNQIIHIDDTNEHSIQTASMAYSHNSIYFMNHANKQELQKFSIFFKKYSNWLEKHKVDKSKFCIDHGGVLGVYGIRDVGDLDFIHDGYDFLMKKHPTHKFLIMGEDLNSHNLFYEHGYSRVSKEDVIYNPNYFFYYKTYKFMNLALLMDIKNNLKRPKDITDLSLISRHLNMFRTGHRQILKSFYEQF
jgi:hypothetical protein